MIKIKFQNTFFCLLITSNLWAQLFNNNWVFGGAQLIGDTATQAVMNVSFNNGVPLASKFPPTDYYMDLAIATISDSSGNLVLYTNGVHLKNANHEIVQNGGSLPNSNMWADVFPQSQGVLLIPMPGHDNQYILFHADIFGFFDPQLGFDGGASNLTYSVVNMNLNGGKGKVTIRKNLMLSDTLTGGQLTCVKHANGRDWWVLTSRYNRNKYFAFLITPDGWENYGVQSFETEMRVSLGQSVFSPDGNWYLRYNTVAQPYSAWFDVYRFDRCTGQLSDHRHIKMASEVQRGGVAVSPNSRFAYVAVYDTIYQFDLHAPDLEASKTVVAVYDGFLDNIAAELEDTTLIPTRFFNMQLAQDNKIYITCPDNSSHYLHYINQPDSAGLACEVVQHGFRLPTLHVYGIPNVPFFGLGKLVGSPCDTLVVSNTETIRPDETVQVFPNPTNNYLHISTKLDLVDYWVYDISGRLVSSGQFQKEYLVDINRLPDGIYFLQIKTQNANMITKKIIKMEE
jgi:hypothetical protein